MRDDEKQGANVIHVQVTVTQSASGFNAVYQPPVVPVKHNNATIRFRLDSETADDILIDTVTVPESAKSQLGTPDISQNRKQVDILDKNTAQETIHVSFTFKNKQGAMSILKSRDCDNGADYPQIENDPPGYDREAATLKSSADSCGADYPQIENDPPG